MSSTKAGSLTIAGSGIASVAHITLETVSYMKVSDKIFYIVCDPATEAFIQLNAKEPAIDLTIYYDENKPRYNSYIQMAEVMLQAVRAGKNVLGIFYGHPGVFVSPTHRALSIARAEGFEAKMLPGVSAEDYLFADLEVDPAMQGCATFEATELLIRDIPLNPTMNNIIWQVGAVGVSDMVFDNAKFHLLVDRLEKDFGLDHKVVHYIGMVLPQSATVKTTFTISELRNADVIQQFNPASTLYVPPRDLPTPSEGMATRLGLASRQTAIPRQLIPAPAWVSPNIAAMPAYGEHERAVIEQLAEHVIPAGHKTLTASPAMMKLTADLGVDIALRRQYTADREAFVNKVEGLTELERKALSTSLPGAVHYVMKSNPSVEITEDQVSSVSPSASAFLFVPPLAPPVLALVAPIPPPVVVVIAAV